ncbi:MAG TPA: hypothetical protein VMV69_08620 [Pirellulales bacterium]|nr:hypothetical protein [Pirellulales bacterium]
MKLAFADTYFYLALLNPGDAGHLAARGASDEFSGRLLTTQWILAEVADALCRPGDRARFLWLIDTIIADPNVTIVAADDRLFNRGVDLFRGRPDKDWPLTDCTSFVVMEDAGVNAAFTADMHFEQAGFIALLK